ncbi:DUF6262 family protein [Nocardia sp. NBC_01499]|uniref:DUF6262 family protein n=1 Tax=Nocardia sp. NBC_01499 TaxID=2903597 RepID=UPI0038704F17
MTSARDRRIAVLTTAAKTKSHNKTRAAEQAIRTLIKRHEPITFQGVGREAGVSHAFLYNHPELRGRIETLRSKSQPKPTASTPPPDSESSLVLALTIQIKQLKQQQRQQVDELRGALTQAHGENLDLRRELARRGWTGQQHR